MIQFIHVKDAIYVALYQSIDPSWFPLSHYSVDPSWFPLHILLKGSSLQNGKRFVTVMAHCYYNIKWV